MTLAARISTQLRQGGAFLVVGGVAFLVDAVTFNLLAFGVDGRGPLFDLPLVAKTVAIVIATVVTYVGNRFWTYGKRSVTQTFSRYVIFIALNIAATAIQLGCLAFSRYVLGLEGVVADNIAGTLVGQVLATAFRYVTYGRWVFPDDGGHAKQVVIEQA
ncbi:GtrA family protein [Microbacterium sp. SLBN-146]|uniref:GtrA family protein n=1 Tax=Microbacterium sp. SLBN-146 TaxID=2768457 RepID=UPI0011533876|nr:GtrA family protein [Microbacterium sp. SLBN-146]TQJ32723.1 putative flippase GtrA [Microbacterium sp. SLBN-146]